jgi:hypothetical protein
MSTLTIDDKRISGTDRRRLRHLRRRYIVRTEDGWGVAAPSLRLLLMCCRGECVDPARIYFIHGDGTLAPFWKRPASPGAER